MTNNFKLKDFNSNIINMNLEEIEELVEWNKTFGISTYETLKDIGYLDKLSFFTHQVKRIKLDYNKEDVDSIVKMDTSIN